MLPVHHPRLEREARLSAEARHAIEIAVGDQLEAHRDEAVVDLPLALQLHFVDVLLGQRVLHLPEAIVVQLGRVDVAADQFRGERLAQRDAAGDGAIGVVRVVDGDVDALVHRILRIALGQLTRLRPAAASARRREPRRGRERERRTAPDDHGQLDAENDERRRDHRADIGEGTILGLEIEEYHSESPRRFPRSRENPSQTENAIGRNAPGANGAPEVRDGAPA